MSIPPPPPRRTPSPIASPPPPDLEARAARRAESQESARRRPRLIVAAVVAVVLVAVGVAVVLAGGGTDEALEASTSVNLEVGHLTVESVNPFEGTPKTFSADARDTALTAVETYVHDATVVALRKGTASDTTLAAVFDEAAVTRLAGTDRALLVDEGLPKAVGKIAVKSPPVALTALMDRDGTIVLITASVDLDIKAQSRRGTTTITRTGTLVLSPQADDSWRITSWTLHVARGGPGVTASPTDATSTTVAT